MVNRFKIKACGRCGGDLALEDNDWRCLQCATYYYAGLYANAGAPEWLRRLLRPECPDATGLGRADGNTLRSETPVDPLAPWPQGSGATRR